MNIYIHNKTANQKTYAGQVLDANSFYLIPSNLILEFSSDNNLLNDLALTYCAISIDGTNDVLTFSEQLDYLKGGLTNTKIISQPDQSPFSAPIYRTKRMKTDAVRIVAPNSEEEILFKLTSELYTHGGAMIVENAKLGDWISAEVEDVDGVIPEPYRASLCEAWPIVGQYIIGEYVEVSGVNSVHKIDTAPLIAKITQGLYLSFHYHAINEGIDRKIAINYYMNKKL